MMFNETKNRIEMRLAKSCLPKITNKQVKLSLSLVICENRDLGPNYKRE